MPPAFRKLRERALAYPGATEDQPWGEFAIKVKGKVFLFLGNDGGSWGFTVKLPRSAGAALRHPSTAPTRSGLGKHGWITAKWGRGGRIPPDVIDEWLEESYRAVAPKRLLSAATGAPMAARRRTKAKRPRGSVP